MRFGSASRILLAALAAVSASACGALYGEPGAPAAPGAISAPAAMADPAAQQAFLRQNASAAGVQTTGSGLQYKVISAGPAGGPQAGIGDEVKVNYKGSLADGTPFDASTPGEPSVFTVGELVPGFNEALMLMRPGDKWVIYIPPQIGYGDQPRGPIPGGSVLVFELELLEVAPRAAASQLG